MKQIQRSEIVQYCNNYLSVEKFPDYCPNGLQVEGASTISKIVTGVSACGELFEKAIEKKADMIIVHHGLLWNELKPITGVFKNRIKLLIENNISLLGYHLPLDAHNKIGNNAILSDEIGLTDKTPFLKYKGNEIGFKGNIDKIKFIDFLKLVEKKVGPIHSYVQGQEYSSKIGICSGGASNDVEDITNDVDTYITGEIGEPTMAFCKEAKINYIALGHYNSETWGVHELGNHLHKKFNIPVEFIKVNNPH